MSLFVKEKGQFELAQILKLSIFCSKRKEKFALNKNKIIIMEKKA